MRLASATLQSLSSLVQRFAYDRDAQQVGIVHFGIGAFHRAHQAWYTDRAVDAGDRDWMISGVSLRAPDVAAQINPQDGLYSVTERSAAGDVPRVVGAVREVLVASVDPQAVVARLAAPTTHIVTLTVTEKGYCRAPDGALDQVLAGPASLYRYLREGLAARRAARLPGLTLISCDNLAGNGNQLKRLLGEHLERHDGALAAWVAAECSFPNSMVDRIVPNTTDAERAQAAGLLGLDDAAAVMTEPFSQWVIEDRFAGPRPRWERVGAQLVSDVSTYEMAKLRMLNGAHSALAYLGLQRGHAFVHEAVADPTLRKSVEHLMREEAAPSIAAAQGQDLMAYADALLARFANPALRHRLAQIAMDGSQKIPQRWLETLAFQQQQGRVCPTILAAIGAWLRHVRGDNAAVRGPVSDPLAAALAERWRAAGQDGIVDAVFGRQGLLASAWTPTVADRQMILNP